MKGHSICAEGVELHQGNGQSGQILHRGHPVKKKYLKNLLIQTCHFELTQNLNECEKKSEHTEKNLNLTIKMALLYRNLYQIQSHKNLNFSKLKKKKI